ncbi:EamA family transporter [Orrella marina]|uniref:Multidrug DMT transporter permease n=1 Tax=Orrella marina TaxID=2163011 RepID=A0A2R4XKJ6_9BURK|nr:EamA family transporter [Orrella marina]AWB34303.1 multidrug DMT transporter permease [Orrella marina]
MDADWTWFWVPATIFAAAAQAGRNAIQKSLTAELGTLGATQVRFLFGFPFACLFFLVAWSFTDLSAPSVSWTFVLFTALGALAQIAATALMLAAMKSRDFVVVTVWTKTEPVQVALFGVVVLSDPLGLGTAMSILLATLGVIWMGYKPMSRSAGQPVDIKPVAFGLLAAAAFAVAAVGFRGAILSLPEGNFFFRASWTLVCGLFIQATVLAIWMRVTDPAAWRKCIGAWKISLGGGFLGAAASQGWFIGFALTTAANVRTLGLVEVFFAQMLSRRLFDGSTSRQEKIGMALIILGVAGLLWLQRG